MDKKKNIPTSNTNKKKTVIFDMDNTLVDSTKRWNLCQNQKKKWDCFFDEKKLELDEPNWKMIELSKKYHKKGYNVIIVTARVERLKEGTIEQLKKFGVEFDDIYMRKDKDFRKDFEIKEELIAKLIEEGHEIEKMFDDKSDVREIISKKFGIITIDPNEINEEFVVI